MSKSKTILSKATQYRIARLVRHFGVKGGVFAAAQRGIEVTPKQASSLAKQYGYEVKKGRRSNKDPKPN